MDQRIENINKKIAFLLKKDNKYRIKIEYGYAFYKNRSYMNIYIHLWEMEDCTQDDVTLLRFNSLEECENKVDELLGLK